MSCLGHLRDGKPCTCIRIHGECIKCKRDITVNHGGNAPHIAYSENKDGVRTLRNYVCFRCRP